MWPECAAAECRGRVGIKSSLRQSSVIVAEEWRSATVRSAFLTLWPRSFIITPIDVKNACNTQ